MPKYYTHLGLSFTDCDGHLVRNYQLVSRDDGKAYAVADFDNDNLVRFAYADTVSDLMPAWTAEVKALVK